MEANIISLGTPSVPNASLNPRILWRGAYSYQSAVRMNERKRVLGRKYGQVQESGLVAEGYDNVEGGQGWRLLLPTDLDHRGTIRVDE